MWQNNTHTPGDWTSGSGAGYYSLGDTPPHIRPSSFSYMTDRADYKMDRCMFETFILTEERKAKPMGKIRKLLKYTSVRYWHFSKARELTLRVRRSWYRFTGNWIMEGLCNTGIAGIQGYKRARKAQKEGK